MGGGAGTAGGDENAGEQIMRRGILGIERQGGTRLAFRQRRAVQSPGGLGQLEMRRLIARRVETRADAPGRAPD